MSAPTGPVLALDTSTATGSVAVGSGGELLTEVALRVDAGHSSALLPAIDYAMRSAGLAARDLRAVVVGAGPGSFTGVRVAAATAKGIVHALGVPMFAFSGLLAIAAASGADGHEVCAVLDARRRDVFAACYRFKRGVEEVFPPEACSLDALLGRFRGIVPPVFAGEGAVLHQDEIKQRLGAPVVPEFVGLPRASALLWLLRTVPEWGMIPDPPAWEPEYLRASGAERIAAAAGRP